jgi:lipopolysaccharide export system permease protein
MTAPATRAGAGHGSATLRRYLTREIYAATLFVAVAFLALFAFFDLINEMGDLGKGQYRLQHAIAFVALSAPSHVYELAPIAVLIGTLSALSQLAASSEYTVMRGSGLSPGAAALMLLRTGIVFVLITFVFGELIAPFSERAASAFKLQATRAIVAQEFRSGLWVKDDSRFVNVREVRPDATLAGLRIFEFDAAHRLLAISSAESGEFRGGGAWLLKNVVRTRFTATGSSVEREAEAVWNSVLTPDIMTVLFVVPERMSAWTLFQYTRHLEKNRQQAERYEIALWKKLIYPFAALVMMALALPFAYIHTRSGGVGVKVFSGIMLGILFHMLNSLFSHLGLLQNWQPFLSAMLPSAVFLAAATLMMWWVERR